MIKYTLLCISFLSIFNSCSPMMIDNDTEAIKQLNDAYESTHWLSPKAAQKRLNNTYYYLHSQHNDYLNAQSRQRSIESFFNINRSQMCNPLFDFLIQSLRIIKGQEAEIEGLKTLILRQEIPQSEEEMQHLEELANQSTIPVKAFSKNTSDMYTYIDQLYHHLQKASKAASEQKELDEKTAKQKQIASQL